MATLKPKKHEKIDFFIADEFEILSLRDDISSMEHPFFALKGGDKKIRNYRNGDYFLTIKPSYDGLATIFDKDIWIYAISKLQQAINENKLTDINLIGRTIFFKPYDFFIVSNRSKGGTAYKELEKALERLSGTRIKTNIAYGDKREIEEFGLIDRWKLIEENNEHGVEIGMVEIVLPNWLFEALEKKQILKISTDYFRIRKAIDRRIYEIARKHCGTQHEFTISIEKLHSKTGSTSNKAEFKRLVKKLCIVNDLPDYEVAYCEEINHVIFRNRQENKPEVIASKQRESGKKAIHKIKNNLLEKNI